MCIQSLRGQPDSVKEGVVSARIFLQSVTTRSGHGIAAAMLSGAPWVCRPSYLYAACDLPVDPGAVFPGYSATAHIEALRIVVWRSPPRSVAYDEGAIQPV